MRNHRQVYCGEAVFAIFWERKTVLEKNLDVKVVSPTIRTPLLAADLHFPPDILVSFAIARFYYPQGLFSRKFRHVPYGVNKLENTPLFLHFRSEFPQWY